jgi:hypothetical protein
MSVGDTTGRVLRDGPAVDQHRSRWSASSAPPIMIQSTVPPGRGSFFQGERRFG